MNRFRISSREVSVALLAGLSACLTGCFLFFLNFIPAKYFVLGILWSVTVTSLDAAYSLSLFLRTYLAAAVGASLGYGCTSLAGFLSTSFEYHISTLIAFPCSILIGLSEEWVNSPLSSFIRQDIARLALFAAASFSDSPESTAWQIVSAFSIGSAVAFLVTLFGVFSLPVAGSVSRLRNAVAEYSTAVVQVFECQVAFLTSGPDHLREVDRRMKRLELSLEEFDRAKKALDMAVWRKPDESLGDLTATITLMPSQLLALTHTLDARYSQELVHQIWAPIAPGLLDLAAAVSMTLRHGGVEHARIPALADKLYADLVEEIARSPAEVAGRFELSRYVFSLLAVLRFARLANRFARCRTSWLASKSGFQFTPIFGAAWSKVSALFSAEAWRATSDWVYPVKLAVIDQTAVQLLLFWKTREVDGFTANAYWAAVALFYCLLPTFGGCLVKGARRLAGTAVGGVFALLSVAATDEANITAIMLQLFIVSFISKLLSQIRCLGYAGLVVSATWIIVALGHYGTDLSTSDYIRLSLDRLLLNVIGASAAVLLGGLMYPNLATRRSSGAVAGVLLTVAELHVGGVKSLSFESEISVADAASTVPAAELVHMYEAAAGFEASAKLRASEAVRKTFKEETLGELRFFSCVKWPWLKRFVGRAKQVYDADCEIVNLEHSALVFFATASSTLLDERAREWLVIPCTLAAQLAEFSAEVSARTLSLVRFINGEDAEISELDVSVTSPILPVGDERRMLLDGGLLRVLALLFVVEDFRQAWNTVVRKFKNSI